MHMMSMQPKSRPLLHASHARVTCKLGQVLCKMATAPALALSALDQCKPSAQFLIAEGQTLGACLTREVPLRTLLLVIRLPLP